MATHAQAHPPTHKVPQRCTQSARLAEQYPEYTIWQFRPYAVRWGHRAVFGNSWPDLAQRLAAARKADEMAAAEALQEEAPNMMTLAAIIAVAVIAVVTVVCLAVR